MCLAVPGKILSTTGDDPITRSGRVSFGGVVKEVSLAYLPEAKADDYVIVHAGFALSIVDEAEATAVFEYLTQLAAEDGEEQEPAP
ncbi:MAG: HypC/HybG/HupF family hydrogenase formation chaperone [Acidobacteria bacterium]|nr:MAG: HypC/HybG/HupF family hydrogenase formation chaperone [Acidobacteriota bacterium]